MVLFLRLSKNKYLYFSAVNDKGMKVVIKEPEVSGQLREVLVRSTEKNVDLSVRPKEVCTSKVFLKQISYFTYYSYRFYELLILQLVFIYGLVYMLWFERIRLIFVECELTSRVCSFI